MEELVMFKGLLWALMGTAMWLTFLFTLWFLAEFFRRERTATKDDDWIERKSKEQPTMCITFKCGHYQAVHVNQLGVCQFDGCSCQVFRR